MPDLITLPKGMALEEVLRDYFLKTGAYVVRGVPFVYESDDVTDIDLWVYSRASSFSREITIVDIKNKKVPHALERIFWVNGLKQATYSNKAIIATTDSRPLIKVFAKKQDVMVLDGKFLSKLVRNQTINEERLFEEQLFSLIDSYELQKIDGDWKNRMKYSKSILSKPINFDSCNSWLSEAKFFAELVLTRERERNTALRCLYLICSYLALGIDFCMREISFLETHERIEKLKEGFLFGDRGLNGTNDLIKFSMNMVSQYVEGGDIHARLLKQRFDNEVSNLPVNILAEYFAKTENINHMFQVAKSLEQMAMQSKAPNLPESFDIKGYLYCLLDYWQISRQEFSAVLNLKLDQ
ncbi:hypothetical protein R4641_15935 [Acinetobacter baumannii]|uniref:hypothetical protein n=1 Tax=Acinetobacter baumannii TaxID=470 RepID=UPI0029567142|nr:hypothetical protein [Acinetobacter baumannii]MDV7609603.1 hypothetical protein [Acinetobacter baumannii]MDV7611394.1 hypothetical protein [Acinetobacter baumannii]MDV7615541.1 hypothetical protein [Acinetobacter baumannii]